MADLRYFSHISPVYGDFYIIPHLFGATHIVTENLSRRLVVDNIAETLVQGKMFGSTPGANQITKILTQADF